MTSRVDEAIYINPPPAVASAGQVWAYLRERRREFLELVYESPSTDALLKPDNMTVSPGGWVLLREDTDRARQTFIKGLTEQGEIYSFAANIRPGTIPALPRRRRGPRSPAPPSTAVGCGDAGSRTRRQARAGWAGWHDEAVASDHESRRTVVVALIANLGIVAKFTAAVITGSTAMFAEGVHSAADTGNTGLLLVAQSQSRQPATSSGLSRGREAYFWALLAAIGVFVVGAVLAIYEGVRELVSPDQAESFAVAYVVLAVAFLADLVSFLRARRHLSGEAHALSRGLLEHVRLTSDPTTRAVFAEDAAGLIGNTLAATGIALHQATGSTVPDAVAAIGIGLVLGTVAVFLVERNRDFLVGEEVAPVGKERIRAIIAGWPGIVAVRTLAVIFTGPDEVLVVARVDIDDDLDGAAVERLVSGIERELRTLEPAIARVDVVPTG